MAFLDLAKARKSIRAFEPSELSHETILTLLDAARHAPSAGNGQPWHFCVVRNASLASRLRVAASNQDTLTAAAAVFVVCIDTTRAEAKYAERGRTLYSIQDTAAAVQNILLCAKDLGLGACWVGAFDETAVAEILALAPNLRPVAILPIGKPAADPAPRRRRELAEITTFFD